MVNVGPTGCALLQLLRRFSQSKYLDSKLASGVRGSFDSANAVRRLQTPPDKGTVVYRLRVKKMKHPPKSVRKRQA